MMPRPRMYLGHSCNLKSRTCRCVLFASQSAVVATRPLLTSLTVGDSTVPLSCFSTSTKCPRRYCKPPSSRARCSRIVRKLVSTAASTWAYSSINARVDCVVVCSCIPDRGARGSQATACVANDL